MSALDSSDPTAVYKANTNNEDTGDSEAKSEPVQGLSKNAQKRAAKAAFLAEKKLERRAREKAAKKEKKRQKREAGEGWYEDEEPSTKKLKREGPVQSFNARVVVDLGFDDMMTDKEITSLASQLAYTYSANRRAARPFSSLLFTSLNGRLHNRLESLNKASYRRWEKTEWWEEGYDDLWVERTDEEDKPDSVSQDRKGKDRSRSEKDKVVYLSADADVEIEELQEGETYVVGGIVDHNRYKSLCQNKAVDNGIRSARLPIGKYIEGLTTRKVLTVNQVFEILVHWTENRNWEKALYSVIPQRKFQQPSKRSDQPPEKGEEPIERNAELNASTEDSEEPLY